MRGQVLGSAIVGLVMVLAGCGGDATQGEDDDAVGQLVTAAGDETIDPNDPPTRPDPVEARASSAGSGGGCARRGEALSPAGLTLVLHVSQRGADAQRSLDHLAALKKYVRDRDVFMLEDLGALDRVHREFPCNAVHVLAFPDGVDRALQTGGLVDGVAIDWEGGVVDGHSEAYTIDRLHAYARAIHHAGKRAGFVPVLPRSFDDGYVERQSKMDYELVQSQGGCVNGPDAFARQVSGVVHQYARHGAPLRDVGFEISMNSFDAAGNHVGAARAAECTRAAYGKGARAIYIYGNGPDAWADYFHALGKMGVRVPQ